jgi:hypothetical protein
MGAKVGAHALPGTKCMERGLGTRLLVLAVDSSMALHGWELVAEV